MGLSIKSEEAERLARELAGATGETLTGAITTALRERLDRVRTAPEAQTAARAALIRKIAGDSAGRWAEPHRRAAHGDLLYDDRGLPR